MAVLLLSVLFFAALSIWIALVCSPRVTAKRFFSDVYTAKLRPVTAVVAVPPYSCVVRWSVVERLVSMSVSLALDLSAESLSSESKDLSLILDLMHCPMKPDLKYISGFGLSTVSKAKVFLRPVSEPKKLEAKLVFSDLDPERFPHEQFELTAQLMI
jgi:hypothetical protein